MTSRNSNPVSLFLALRAAVSVSSSMTTSPMCHTSTPRRTHPVTALVFLPKLACMCSFGFSSSSGKIVPTPQASCTPLSSVVMGSGGSALPSLGPTTTRLFSLAPPKKKHSALEIFCLAANCSRTSGKRSPSCNLRMKILPGFASVNCMV